MEGQESRVVESPGIVLSSRRLKLQPTELINEVA